MAKSLKENVMADLAVVCGAFGITDDIIYEEKLTNGNVNLTYHVKMQNGKEYIIQRMNPYAYKNPQAVMRNIAVVTELMKKSDVGLTCPWYLPVISSCNVKMTAEAEQHGKDDDGAEMFKKSIAEAEQHGKDADGAEMFKKSIAEKERSGEEGSINFLFFYEDAYWRVCEYIDSITCNKSLKRAVAYETGEAFGIFASMMAEADIKKLQTTIPGFHDTEGRYKKLDETVSDPHIIPERLSEVSRELAWLNQVRERACILSGAQHEGHLPLRVTHNDTKTNNVLFGKFSGKAIAIIDMDTVMPGLTAHDFGDAVRYAAGLPVDIIPEGTLYCDTKNRPTTLQSAIASEGTLYCDTKNRPTDGVYEANDGTQNRTGNTICNGESTGDDNGKRINTNLYFNRNIFEAVCEGFLPKVRAILTTVEKETLYLGPFTMAVELAVRYITDYLEGDRYFSIGYPEQNLDKARGQITLAKDMLDNEAYIKSTIDGYLTYSSK